MALSQRASARPPIILSETDADRLSSLAIQSEGRVPEVTALLLDELDRAEVRPDQLVGPQVVGMNATVEFIDEAHGAARTVQLVYPAEADIGAGKISVLTPVGAGLIGLSAGQSISWPDREGNERILKIVRVARNPASA